MTISDDFAVEGRSHTMRWNFDEYSDDALEDLINVYYTAALYMRSADVGNRRIIRDERARMNKLIDSLKAELDMRDENR